MFEMDYLKENVDKAKIKKFLLFLLLVSVFFSLFYAFHYWTKQNSLNKDDAKLKEVQEISEKIKDFPTAFKTDEYLTSRSLDACVFKYFKSKADLNEVGSFYEKELLENSWTHENQEDLIFKKAQVSFSLERRYEKNTDWDFAVSICWKNQP